MEFRDEYLKLIRVPNHFEYTGPLPRGLKPYEDLMKQICEHAKSRGWRVWVVGREITAPDA